MPLQFKSKQIDKTVNIDELEKTILNIELN